MYESTGIQWSVASLLILAMLPYLFVVGVQAYLVASA